MAEFDTPLSNVEALLQNTLGAENEVAPQSRVEELLDKLDKELDAMDIGTASNVTVRVEDNKIKLTDKEGG
jgi:hypothetical protein